MGKRKYIETPEKMWEYFEEYRTNVKSNPRFKNELDKFGNIVPIPLERPLTLEGFECYLNENGIMSHLSDYFANTDNRYSDYTTICSRVKRAIKDDQITGGMVGQYNASITQRLNNLVEKVQNDVTVTKFEFGND
jgi:hypothetical protein